MLVSPIPVSKLLRYFDADEEGLLRAKAAVELAIHQWILSVIDGSSGCELRTNPEPIKFHRMGHKRPSTERPTSAKPIPEWKRLRPNAGKVWTQGEKSELLRLFDTGVAVSDIATRLGRGSHSVEVPLCKLGRGRELKAG